MVKRGVIIASVVLVVLITLTNGVLSEDLNLTGEEMGVRCIQSSEEVLRELATSNFSFVRVNDSIRSVKAIFETQQALSEKGKIADYSGVIKGCEDIASIRRMAFDLRDEIKVLAEFREATLKNLDAPSVDNLFSEISKEMTNERYELVPPIIDKTYAEITYVQSRATTLNVFYDATTRGVKRFFRERWKEVLLGSVLLIVLFFSFKNAVRRYILRRKIYFMEIRKKSLKDMITKNQEDYFNKGKISEESFTIKSKKLVELIRDVDRELSLLKERLLIVGKSIESIKQESLKTRSPTKVKKSLPKKK